MNEKRETQLQKFVDDHFSMFTTEDKDLFVKEVIQLYKDHPEELNYTNKESILTLYIYLKAKCPANADAPIKLYDLNQIYNVSNKTEILRLLKSLGVQTCRITPIHIFRNPKYLNPIRELVVPAAMTEEEFKACVDMAEDLYNKHRVSHLGKDPYGIAAGLIYGVISLGLWKTREVHHGFIRVTQGQVAKIFGTSELSVRHEAYRLGYSNWSEFDRAYRGAYT